MSGLTEDRRLTAVLDLHQARPDGHCSQCRTSWPCTTYITLTGRPHQTVALARGMTGLLPMSDTLLTQVDQIATRHLGALDTPATHTRGCDWSAYGLIPGPWTILMPDGQEVPAFPLAPAPEGG
ncbi:hypothetical protein [Nocardiopsis alba]|uniref:hypothetical protein n=1 Tax=Nocardiopsis alba TaxID=53437 RepID=UPI0033A57720